MIYTGLKDWERALHFYEIAVIWPINNKVSMIQVEAYKKRVLVGILAYGGVSTTVLRLRNVQMTKATATPNA